MGLGRLGLGIGKHEALHTVAGDDADQESWQLVERQVVAQLGAHVGAGEETADHLARQARTCAIEGIGQFRVARCFGNHHALHRNQLVLAQQVEELVREVADHLAERTHVLVHVAHAEELVAPGHQHRIQQAGLAAELHIDGAHRNARGTGDGFQAGAGIAVGQEQAGGGVDQILGAGFDVACLRTPGTARAGCRRQVCRQVVFSRCECLRWFAHAVTVNHQQMKCNRFIS